jgi:hypothetical protein
VTSLYKAVLNPALKNENKKIVETRLDLDL